MGNGDYVNRRKFLQYTGIGLSSLVLGKGLLGNSTIVQAARPDKQKGVADPGWHGMCYLDGEKHEYLVASKEKGGNGVPIYIFSSEGFEMGTTGPQNPLACFDFDNSGVETCYLPNRLQNNVFKANGVLWRMFTVEGVGLYAEVNGVKLFSTGNPDHIETRNLVFEPFRSFDEIVAYNIENPGALILTDLGVAFNCPLVDADGHPVMDLNPDVA